MVKRDRKGTEQAKRIRSKLLSRIKYSFGFYDVFVERRNSLSTIEYTDIYEIGVMSKWKVSNRI